METSVQFFRHDQKLTAHALGEPSMTLVRNDSEFGLLVSQGLHEDSYTGRLYLDGATHLHVAGRQWHFRDFDSVAIYRHEGVWFAQDVDTGGYFPQPSHRAYHTVFISLAEYREMSRARANGQGYPVFEAAQQHFGRLPGFSYRSRSLTAPEDYANLPEAVALAEYVHGLGEQA